MIPWSTGHCDRERDSLSHFLIPWVQKPIIFDYCSRPQNVPIIAGNEDFQKVNTSLCILFWLAAGQLPCVWASVGEDYDELLPPSSITTDVFKSVVAQFDVRELITQQVLWKNLCTLRYVLISLVNKELDDLWLGRKRMSRSHARRILGRRAEFGELPASHRTRRTQNMRQR